MEKNYEFKVGDKVKIREGSEYYWGTENNPKGTTGTVVRVWKYPIYVDWGNGMENCYQEFDLELVNEEFPKNVLPKDDIRSIRDRIYQIEDELAKLQQEKESLVTLLKEEGFILVKNVVENEVPNSEYMIDPNNWKKGDLITYVGEDIAGAFTSGSIYEFEGVDVNGWVDVLMDDAGNPNGTRPEWFVWRSRPTD